MSQQICGAFNVALLFLLSLFSKNLLVLDRELKQFVIEETCYLHCQECVYGM
jgi:hypothetical protein